MSRPKRRYGDRWTVEDSIRARQGGKRRPGAEPGPDGRYRPEDYITGPDYVSYQVQVTKPNGQKETYKAESLREARTIRDRERTAVREGSFVPNNNTTVAEYADQWLSRVQTKDSTRAQYKRQINHIKAVLGDTKLQDLRSGDVEQFIYELQTFSCSGKPARPASSKTKTVILTLLSAILNKARRDGLIHANPCDDVKRPAVAAPQRRRQLPDKAVYQRGAMVLSEADVEELLAHLKGRDTWLPALILWRTGLRRGELLALRWDCVYLDSDPPGIWVTRTETNGGEVSDTPKTAQSYGFVEIDPELAEVLRQHRDAQAADVAALTGEQTVGNWYVVSPAINAAKPRRGSSFTSRLSRHLAGTRFAEVTPHCLRHAHGSHLLSRGYSVPEGAARLRETQQTFMRWYSHAIHGSRSMADVFRRGDAQLAAVVKSGKSKSAPALRVVK